MQGTNLKLLLTLMEMCVKVGGARKTAHAGPERDLVIHGNGWSFSCLCRIARGTSDTFTMLGTLWVPDDLLSDLFDGLSFTLENPRYHEKHVLVLTREGPQLLIMEQGVVVQENLDYQIHLVPSTLIESFS